MGSAKVEAVFRFLPRLLLSKRAIPPVALLISLMLSSLALAAPPLEVEWKNGRLSVTADAALADILREIARRTGVKIEGLDDLREEVSVRFSDASLADGLKRLLRDHDYVIVETASGQGGTKPVLTQIFGRGGHVPRQGIVGSAERALQVKLAPEDKDSRSLEALASEGSDEALRKAMSHPDPSVQAAALDLLAARDPQRSVPFLIQGTKSNQPEVRLRALDLLNGSRADEGTVLSVLGETFAGDDIELKRYAIRALAQRGGPAAIGHLRQSLRDSDSAVRMLTLDAIVRSVPLDQRIPLLQEAAQDRDEEVRSAASTWLKEGAGADR